MNIKATEEVDGRHWTSCNEKSGFIA